MCVGYPELCCSAACGPASNYPLSPVPDANGQNVTLNAIQAVLQEMVALSPGEVRATYLTRALAMRRRGTEYYQPWCSRGSRQYLRLLSQATGNDIHIITCCCAALCLHLQFFHLGEQHNHRLG